MKYLKQFLAGSSSIVVIPFYYGFNKLKRKEYSFFNYSIIAPLWFGIWNVLSFILAEQLKLSIKQRFLFISLISCLSIVIFNKYNNTYDFTNKQWQKYYSMMIFAYLFTWNIVIYNIENLIS